MVSKSIQKYKTFKVLLKVKENHGILGRGMVCVNSVYTNYRREGQEKRCPFVEY